MKLEHPSMANASAHKLRKSPMYIFHLCSTCERSDSVNILHHDEVTLSSAMVEHDDLWVSDTQEVTFLDLLVPEVRP